MHFILQPDSCKFLVTHIIEVGNHIGIIYVNLSNLFIQTGFYVSEYNIFFIYTRIY